MSDRLMQSSLNESLHGILTAGEIREGIRLRAELDARLLRFLQVSEADTAMRANVPQTMMCPITMELIQDPVINTVSHMTYDGNAMNHWVNSCRQGGRPYTDPVTRQVFDPETDLVPNRFARNIIEEWSEANVAGAQVTTPPVVLQGQCEMVLQGHTSPVRSVIQLADRRLASIGSRDNTILISSTSTGLCEMVLQGHTNDVKSVIQLMDGRLASGSRDKTIRIWS